MGVAIISLLFQIVSNQTFAINTLVDFYSSINISKNKNRYIVYINSWHAQ